MRVSVVQESWCYQAAATVEGALLLDVLEQRPELLEHLDSENFALMYLLGLLTNLQVLPRPSLTPPSLPHCS